MPYNKVVALWSCVYIIHLAILYSSPSTQHQQEEEEKNKMWEREDDNFLLRIKRECERDTGCWS